VDAGFAAYPGVVRMHRSVAEAVMAMVKAVEVSLDGQPLGVFVPPVGEAFAVFVGTFHEPTCASRWCQERRRRVGLGNSRTSRRASFYHFAWSRRCLDLAGLRDVCLLAKRPAPERPRDRVIGKSGQGVSPLDRPSLSASSLMRGASLNAPHNDALKLTRSAMASVGAALAA